MSKRSNLELMDPKEIARLLDCHPQTVAAMARAGRLTPIDTPLAVRYHALEVLAVWRAGKPWQGCWSKGGKSC